MFGVLFFNQRQASPVAVGSAHVTGCKLSVPCAPPWFPPRVVPAVDVVVRVMWKSLGNAASSSTARLCSAAIGLPGKFWGSLTIAGRADPWDRIHVCCVFSSV